jgi:hypothetical protein
MLYEEVIQGKPINKEKGEINCIKYELGAGGAHFCNRNYSQGRDQEDQVWKPTR